MTQSKEVIPSGEAVVLIPLTQLKSSPLNSRKSFDQKKIEELAKNIESGGLINPIIVRIKDVGLGDPKDYDYEIVAGERRKRAFSYLLRKEIPCIVREYTDEEVESLQLAENIHREDLSPMEECEAYNKLFQHHKTVKRVSEIAGKSENYVSSRMQLVKLIPALQNCIKNKSLPVGQAEVISKLPEEQQKELTKTYDAMTIEQGKVIRLASVEKLKKIIADIIYIPINSACFDLKDKNLNPKMGACTECEFNTGCNSVLFSDMTDEAFCAKGSCFWGKTLKHINARITQLKSASEKVIMLYEEDYYYGSNKKKVNDFEAIASCDYIISNKRTESSIIGIFVEKKYNRSKYNVGQEVFITEKPKEEKAGSHNGSRANSAPPDESPLEQRERRMKKRFAKEDELDKNQVRKQIMIELFKKSEIKSSVLREAAIGILEHFSLNNSLVYDSYGDKIASIDENYAYTVNSYSNRKTRDNLISRLKNEKDLLVFLLRCVISHNLQILRTENVNISDTKNDPLIEFAKDYQIDIPAIHKKLTDQRKTERAQELADLEAAKKRAKEKEKKAKMEKYDTSQKATDERIKKTNSEYDESQQQKRDYDKAMKTTKGNVEKALKIVEKEKRNRTERKSKKVVKK